MNAMASLATNTLVGLLVTFLCWRSASAVFISIDANAQECFHDTVKAHTKMGLTFEVSEGGFLDIDVKINDPRGREIYSSNRETNARYVFAAEMDGVYTYCFSNKMSTMTPKTVLFNMEIGDHAAAAKKEDDSEHHNKLEEMVAQLSTALMSIKHEQDYMEVRERVHRMINDNTNSRVAWWAFFEDILLVCMTLGQVYYMKRFFEVRRIV